MCIVFRCVVLDLSVDSVRKSLLFSAQVLEMETEEALRRAEIAQNDRDSQYKFRREVSR